MTMLYVFIFVIVMLAIFARIGASNEKKKKEIERLKAIYDSHLLGTDKRAALDSGRDYYSCLRNGKLTVYDEQAIANDLSLMKI